MARKVKPAPTGYTVKVVYAGTEEEGRKALKEARRYVFARMLEKIRRERGERVC